jgi:hypothetical protein
MVSIIFGTGASICTEDVVASIKVQNFTQMGGHADILDPFIWSRVSGQMRFRNGSDKGTASVHQILFRSWKMWDGDPGND